MNMQPAMLACYERIERASRRMAAAARQGDWTTFAEAEADCAHQIRRIRMIGDPETTLDAAGRARRLELVGQILSADARVRESTQPCVARLDRYVRRSAPKARA
jgi:hypothetical protein